MNILAKILGIGLVFLIMSFINWNYNPQYWGWTSRIILILWILIIIYKKNNF